MQISYLTVIVVHEMHLCLVYTHTNMYTVTVRKIVRVYMTHYAIKLCLCVYT